MKIQTILSSIFAFILFLYGCALSYLLWNSDVAPLVIKAIITLSQIWTVAVFLRYAYLINPISFRWSMITWGTVIMLLTQTTVGIVKVYSSELFQLIAIGVLVKLGWDMLQVTSNSIKRNAVTQ